MKGQKTKAAGGRWFDDVERAAAASRLAKGARERTDVSEPALFVLRMAHPSALFAWEVRMYGAIVIDRGDGYATEALARAAGGRALIAMPSRSGRPRGEPTGAGDPAPVPCPGGRAVARPPEDS